MLNNKGLALPLVLMVMLVLFLFGTALLQYSTSEALQVAREEKLMQAHYLARSGASSMDKWLRTNRYLQEEYIESNILNRGSSSPVSLGNGTLQTEVSGTLQQMTITATGSVEGVSDVVTVRLNFTEGALPDPEDINTVFPDEYELEGDGWTPGTDDPGGTEWVDNSTGKIEAGNTLDDTVEGGVIFPDTIVVEHQAGQAQNNTIDFYAYYMYFGNPTTSLSIKNGNILRLHADILVFKGEVELTQAGVNYAELSLHVLPGKGINIAGNLYGTVYFFGDVINNSGEVIIPSGSYYFRDGTIIRSTPIVIPSMDQGSFIPYIPSGSSGSSWGN